MKKLSLFFILFLFFGLCFYKFTINTTYAVSNQKEYVICFDEKNYYFRDSDFKINLSSEQKKHYHNFELLKKLKQIGLSDEESINYIFPEIKELYKKISLIFEVKESEDKISVIPNTCKVNYINGVKGISIDKQKLYKDILGQIENEKIKININLIEYKNKENAKNLFTEKSCFSTNFSTSSPERKNNIRTALKSLDGIIIEEGEVISFNEITGDRNENSGYRQAKIISNGTFVLGYGGGVCQVSTTLYNACLLSNLEIVEANSHSLPVSYVEPGFDAMVNSGSSDLKIRNNSGGKILITTSSLNDICKIKIYGLKNKYKITRQSEKLSIIPAEEDIIETDYKKYGDIELDVGEEKRLSYSKDGYVSRAYINYYDEKGVLVERKMIRENKYNATKGVILKRKN